MPLSSIIVLGMHRSGTSCLTGSLEQCGLYLGDVNRKALHNAKGNCENRDIIDLNDAVLSTNGGTWSNPPEAPTVWSEAHRKRRDRILASYPDDRTIGFKDPRSLLTLEGWLEAVPETRFAGTFRHPFAVAQSLNTRNGIPFQKGLDLWLSYNRRLVAVSGRHEMPLINFDLPAGSYELELRRICGMLSLTPPTDGFDFFEARLRRASAPPHAELTPEVAETYQTLLMKSEQRPLSVQ